MRRVILALVLVLSISLAGCLGPKTVDWGSDGIEVDFSSDSATIKSGFGDKSMEFEDLQPVGCDQSDSTSLSIGASTPISFSGYLAASNFYDSHDSINGIEGLDYAVTVSAAIQSMSFSDAEKVVEGDGARIDLKEWNQPLFPQTRAGTADLDEIDSDSDDDWYVLAMIPTTENIHDGMRSLHEWHQPVIIEGYLVNSTGSSATDGYFRSQYSPEVDSNCNLLTGTNRIQNLYVLVDNIVLEDAVVTDDGDAKNEWAYGDVPFFGRVGYILFFLIVGIGGGFGLFILSQLFVIQGAKSTMKTLLGKEGMEKIKKVASDLRRSKAMGMISPKERKRQIEREAKEAAKEEAKAQKASSKAAKSSEKTEISGFDLDSVLSSAPSSGSASEFGSGKSSVVATVESIEMDKVTEDKGYQEQEYTYQQDSTPSWTPPVNNSPRERTSSNVVTNEPSKPKREHFSSVANSNSSAPVKKKNTVRKRKSVKRSPPEPEVEPEHEPKQSGFGEQDDFSDFSL